MAARWSKEEEDALRKLGMDAVLPGRSYRAIIDRLRILQLMYGPREKRRDQLYLLWEDPSVTTRQIADKLCIEVTSVYAQARKLKLGQRPDRTRGGIAAERRAKAGMRKKTTEMLMVLWGDRDISTQHIADMLGLTKRAVAVKASRLGLGKRPVGTPRTPYGSLSSRWAGLVARTIVRSYGGRRVEPKVKMAAGMGEMNPGSAFHAWGGRKMVDQQ